MLRLAVEVERFSKSDVRARAFPALAQAEGREADGAIDGYWYNRSAAPAGKVSDAFLALRH